MCGPSSALGISAGSPETLARATVPFGDVRDEIKDNPGLVTGLVPAPQEGSLSVAEMTNAEKATAMQKLFGAGTYESRAREALPGILERLQMQEMARLQNVPSLSTLPSMQGAEVAQMNGFQPGLLQSLATQGMRQINQGQQMNPTILKAKA